LTLNLPGAYNIYNALAALALARAMEIPDDLVEASLEKTTASFGRTENIMMNKTPLKMLLVKNPAGYNQVINLVINSPKKSQAIFALNDRIADGTDISWIWDVDFETLAKESGKYFEKIYLTGIRAADLAMRFEYAGFDMKKVAIVEDYDELLNLVAKSELETFIFQTYTAMFEIRRKIAERVDLKEFYD
jgi:UDP-N-acetylmuramyl tripeptide synthase